MDRHNCGTVKGIPAAKIKRAPVLTLFFLWRLHEKPRHAYSLMEDIRSVGFLQCKPSTIYAVLDNMEKSGLVKSHIDTKSMHVRRMYQTTPKGWKLLDKVKARHIRGLWREFVTFLLS